MTMTSGTDSVRLNTFIAFQATPDVDDDVEATPLPRVVPWETLDAGTYHSEIADLGAWVAWLIDTYEIGPDTIPDCWANHPNLREDLSHLRTAWLLTRHPDAGIGAAGVEWDRHRDTTLDRLRTMTGRTGCTSSAGHKPRATKRHWQPTGPTWTAHLTEERTWRDSAGITFATYQTAAAILQTAELRAQAADTAVAAHPDNPAAAERALATATRRIPADAANSAALDSRTVNLAQQLDTHQRDVDAARDHLARCIATHADSATRTAAIDSWLDQLEHLAPNRGAVHTAIRRHRNQHAAREAAADRHPGVQNLLDDSPDTQP